MASNVPERHRSTQSGSLPPLSPDTQSKARPIGRAFSPLDYERQSYVFRLHKSQEGG